MFEQGPQGFDDRDKYNQEEKELRDLAIQKRKEAYEAETIAISEIKRRRNYQTINLKGQVSETEIERIKENAELQIEDIKEKTQVKIIEIDRDLLSDVTNLKKRYNIVKQEKLPPLRQTTHTKDAKELFDTDADSKITDALNKIGERLREQGEYPADE